MTNTTLGLCTYVSSLSCYHLSKHLEMDVRYRLLDWFGCAIGAANKPISRQIRDVFNTDISQGRCTVIGGPFQLSSQDAAFVNGCIGHVLEYDDTNKVAIAHPAGPVIPAVIAVAEQENLSLDCVLNGILAGYEIIIRYGATINPTHYKHWHTTGTCGAFAAAVAVCRALECSSETMVRAVGLASTLASGLTSVFGTNAKLITVGNAARNGVLAAYLSRAGLSAPEDMLGDGEGSYAAAAARNYNTQWMRPQAGDSLMIEDAYYKLHASCAHTHCALDAVSQLLHDTPFTAAEVQSITVDVYTTAYNLTSQLKNETEDQAKFSMPYCVACMIIYGRVSLYEFSDDILKDPKLCELASRVTTKANPQYDLKYPNIRTQTVKITLKDGRVLSDTVDLPKGRPPLPDSVLVNKFLSLISDYWPNKEGVAFHDTLMTLPYDAKIQMLTNIIRRNNHGLQHA